MMRPSALISALALLLMSLPACARGSATCPPQPITGLGVSRIDLGGRVTHVAAGEGAVWAVRMHHTQHGRSDLLEVDPATGRIVGRPIPFWGAGIDLDVGEGGVWVVTSRGLLLEVDPDSHRVLHRILVGHGSQGVAAGEGAVWVTNASEGSVARIDPMAARVVATVRVGNGPARVLAGAGGVWVQTEVQNAPLYRIDPTTDRVTGKLDVLLENLGLHAVWVTGPWAPNGGLRRIDPNTLLPLGPTLGFDITPASVGVAGKELWVGRFFYYCKLHNPIPEGPPIVSFAWFRVDPATLQPLSGPVFVGDPGIPVFVGGAFWIAPEYGGNDVIQVDLAEAGRVRPRPTPGLPSPATPAP
jgi:hypothetical protein